MPAATNQQYMPASLNHKPPSARSRVYITLIATGFLICQYGKPARAQPVSP